MARHSVVKSARTGGIIRVPFLWLRECILRTAEGKRERTQGLCISQPQANAVCWTQLSKLSVLPTSHCYEDACRTTGHFIASYQRKEPHRPEIREVRAITWDAAVAINYWLWKKVIPKRASPEKLLSNIRYFCIPMMICERAGSRSLFCFGEQLKKQTKPQGEKSVRNGCRSGHV